ncbi:MAG: RNA polymerase sigma factor [Wenzhouxiangellaceae bacterium]
MTSKISNLGQKLRQGLDRLTDEEIVSRILAGDTGLFELIMRRYNQRLYRIARGVLRSEAEAEDAVQDAYIAAFYRLGQFSATGNFGGWLCKVAVNQALMRRRRLKSGPELVSDSNRTQYGDQIMCALESESDNPEREAGNAQVRRVLERAIDELPQPFRTTFILREVDQLSVSETAEILDIPMATVKSRTHRARNLLRSELDAELSNAVRETFGFAGKRCDRIVDSVMKRIEYS